MTEDDALRLQLDALRKVVEEAHDAARLQRDNPGVMIARILCAMTVAEFAAYVDGAEGKTVSLSDLIALLQRVQVQARTAARMAH